MVHCGVVASDNWSQAVHASAVLRSLCRAPHGVDLPRVLRYVYQQKPADDTTFEASEAVATLQDRTHSRRSGALQYLDQIAEEMGLDRHFLLDLRRVHCCSPSKAQVRAAMETLRRVAPAAVREQMLLIEVFVAETCA
jgi:hypothetical protein